MRYSRLFLIAGVMLASNAFAAKVSVDPLYWRATESIDWALDNNMVSGSEEVTYLTVDFKFKPGVRLSAIWDTDWRPQLIYTYYRTREKETVSGHLTSAFLGGKIANPSGSYSSGSLDFKIDYDVFDVQFGKAFVVTPHFTLLPIVGVKAGRIDQHIQTAFQGAESVVEKMKNNFTGVGPKVGIGTEITFSKKKESRTYFAAQFASSYVFGHWDLGDVLSYEPPSTKSNIDIAVDNHQFGSLAIEARMGLNVDYKSMHAGLYYDLTDWFNQAQIFDDATGGHTNDLILQGVRAELGFVF